MPFLSYRKNSIAVSIALLFVFVPIFPDTNAARWAAFILFLIYNVGLWQTSFISSSRMMCLLFALLYIAALGYWFAFDNPTGLILTLQGFLISFIAMRLPSRTAAIMGSSIVLCTLLLMNLHDGKPWELLLRQDLFIFVGLFAVFRLIRLRRLRDEEQRQHTKELTIMHDDLAKTHAKLQQAYEDLKLANVQSLHYAVMEERSRIARDIHDSIGHRLTSIIIQLQALPYVLKNDETQSSQIVKTVLEVARGCLHEVRSTVHNMEADETRAGVISLRSLVQQTAASGSLQIHLEINDEAEQEAWPPETSVVLYRSLQEALTNTIRHANAQQVNVSVEQSNHEVVMHYNDDGELTPASNWQEGFGLSGIRKRCRDAGGRCSIKAREPHGIAIDIWLPIEPTRRK